MGQRPLVRGGPQPGSDPPLLPGRRSLHRAGHPCSCSRRASDPPCPPAWGLRGLCRPPSSARGFVRREAAASAALTADRVGPASPWLSVSTRQTGMGLVSPREARPAPLAVLGADPASPLFSKSPSNPDAPLRRADLHPATGPSALPGGAAVTSAASAERRSGIRINPLTRRADASLHSLLTPQLH